MKHEGNLMIETQADADKYAGLTKVTGNLSIYASVKLDALKSVGGNLSIYASAKLDAAKLYAKGFDAFKVYDGIACVVLSTKKKADIEILICRQAKIKQGKLIGKKFFVAKKGDQTAHADSLKTTLEELAFKLGDRDIEQYRHMPKHICKTPQDWAFVYRMVTGACQYGTKDFMERKGKLKKYYTLEEILEQTKGAFGHEKFTEVVA